MRTARSDPLLHEQLHTLPLPCQQQDDSLVMTPILKSSAVTQDNDVSPALTVIIKYFDFNNIIVILIFLGYNSLQV